LNLNALAGPLAAAVMPQQLLTIKLNTGYTTGADGKRTPTYAAPQTAYGSVQAMSNGELWQLDGLNLQGARYKIYVNGRVDGLVRNQNKGGDIIQTPDGGVWLVTMVLEDWPDWTCVAVTLQNGA
jgi:hypothetical protein